MKKCPLLVILIISAVMVVLCGFTLPSENKNSILPDIYVSRLCTDLHNGELFTSRQKVTAATVHASVQNITQNTVQETAQTSAEPVPDVKTPPQADTKSQFIQVDKKYFDDAVFIGDSRMVGLGEYSGFNNSSFYATVGMTVYDLFNKAFVSTGGHTRPITLERALQRKQFGKIYIMVGINEMGTGSLKNFTDAYQAAVQRIEKLQPKAIIFIQGILYVTGSRSNSDHVFNNQNIRARNKCLSELADGKRSFYIDVNEVTSDSNGNLNSDYSGDSCHLKAQYYSLWTDFLMKHGVSAGASGK